MWRYYLIVLYNPVSCDFHREKTEAARIFDGSKNLLHIFWAWLNVSICCLCYYSIWNKMLFLYNFLRDLHKTYEIKRWQKHISNWHYRQSYIFPLNSNRLKSYYFSESIRIWKRATHSGCDSGISLKPT